VSRLLLRVGGGAGPALALAAEVRRVGLDGASSTSLAAEDASDGAGEGEGTLFRVVADVELTARADLRGGMMSVVYGL
jgi:hypothetical protein